MAVRIAGENTKIERRWSIGTEGSEPDLPLIVVSCTYEVDI